MRSGAWDRPIDRCRTGAPQRRRSLAYRGYERSPPPRLLAPSASSLAVSVACGCDRGGHHIDGGGLLARATTILS